MGVLVALRLGLSNARLSAFLPAYDMVPRS